MSLMFERCVEGCGSEVAFALQPACCEPDSSHGVGDIWISFMIGGKGTTLNISRHWQSN